MSIQNITLIWYILVFIDKKRTMIINIIHFTEIMITKDKDIVKMKRWKVKEKCRNSRI